MGDRFVLRNWNEFLDHHAFKLPESVDKARERLLLNAEYYVANYLVVFGVCVVVGMYVITARLRRSNLLLFVIIYLYHCLWCGGTCLRRSGWPTPGLSFHSVSAWACGPC